MGSVSLHELLRINNLFWIVITAIETRQSRNDCSNDSSRIQLTFIHGSMRYVKSS